MEGNSDSSSEEAQKNKIQVREAEKITSKK